MTRRLAAIMYTDIAGYTPLAQKDESAALRLLRDQERLIRGLLEVHKGRLVKSMGDGLLIEFSNALDAVECAVDLQRHIQERNTREPSPELRVRIGIHLGDVEGVGPDILGDAVNVASRIEPLAEPGGVCLSEPVYGQVRNKVSFQLETLGLKTLKGVQEPLEVYRVVVPERAVVGAPLEKVSGLPRLAVLPFANRSPDPKDEHFADGLTEELITILSQLQNLQVVARTSVIQYKTAPKPMDQIGAELGVTAVLEGSVRKADDRLRITVQLIDVASQSHIWANTYDRKLDDIFTIKTEVAKRIAEALKIRLAKAEVQRLAERTPVHPDSYLAYLKGRNIMSSIWTESNLEEAKRQFEAAVSIDPRNAAAYAGLASVTESLGVHFHLSSRSEWGPAAQKFANKALELDPNLAEAHCSLGHLLADAWDFEAAETEFQRAISLSPSYAQARFLYASLLAEAGRPEEALRELAIAEESDPHSVMAASAHANLLIALRRLEEARVKLEQLRQLGGAEAEYFSLLSYFWLVQSDFRQALEAADRREAIAPGRYWDDQLWVYALSGERERARKVIEEREAKWTKDTIEESGLAACYALLGDLDSCFRIIDRSLAQGGLNLSLFRIEPLLEGVRRDRRFAMLLRKLNVS